MLKKVIKKTVFLLTLLIITSISYLGVNSKGLAPEAQAQGGFFYCYGYCISHCQRIVWCITYDGTMFGPMPGYASECCFIP